MPFPSRMPTLFSGVLLLAALLLSHPSNAEEVTIEHNGLTLNGTFSPGDDASPEDRLVLIVHGTLAHNSMETIANLSAILNERGLNTLAINLSLGIDNRHGMYDCAVPHRHAHLDALGEIDAWISWAEQQGAGSIVLFGHSRGGNQVARYAAESGGARLERVVLMAPATWNEEEAAAGYEKTHGTPLGTKLTEAEAQIAAGNGGEFLPGAGLLYCPGADVTAESFVSYYRPDPRFDTPSILSEIDVPVLVIASSEDQVVEGLAERVAPMSDETGLVFAEVDGADHFFLDLFGEDVADSVEEFLGAGDM